MDSICKSFKKFYNTQYDWKELEEQKQEKKKKLLKRLNEKLINNKIHFYESSYIYEVFSFSLLPRVLLLFGERSNNWSVNIDSLLKQRN